MQVPDQPVQWFIWFLSTSRTAAEAVPEFSGPECSRQKETGEISTWWSQVPPVRAKSTIPAEVKEIYEWTIVRMHFIIALRNIMEWSEINWTKLYTFINFSAYEKETHYSINVFRFPLRPVQCTPTIWDRALTGTQRKAKNIDRIMSFLFISGKINECV